MVQMRTLFTRQQLTLTLRRSSQRLMLNSVQASECSTKNLSKVVYTEMKLSFQVMFAA